MGGGLGQAGLTGLEGRASFKCEPSSDSSMVDRLASPISEPSGITCWVTISVLMMVVQSPIQAFTPMVALPRTKTPPLGQHYSQR